MQFHSILSDLETRPENENSSQDISEQLPGALLERSKTMLPDTFTGGKTDKVSMGQKRNGK